MKDEASTATSIAPADRVEKLFDLLRRVADGIEGLRGDLARATETRSLASGANAPAMELLAPSLLLDASAMSALLGCDRRTLRRWEVAGSVPKAIHIGGAKRWRRAEVEAWLEKKRK